MKKTTIVIFFKVIIPIIIDTVIVAVMIHNHNDLSWLESLLGGFVVTILIIAVMFFGISPRNNNNIKRP